MAILQIPVLGDLLKFIYYVGAGVEGFFIMLFTTLVGLLTVVLHLLKKALWFFYPPMLFERICRLGGWLMDMGVLAGRYTAKAAVIISRSIAHDFSYWASGLALLGVLVLAVVGRYYTVALRLEVDGQPVGIVSRETDYTSAVDRVERELVEVLGENYAMESMFTSRFCMVNRNRLTNDEDLFSTVYGIITEEIGDTFGIYVDGELIGATEKKETIQTILDAVKAPYVTGAANEKVEFVKDVDIRCGLYPDSKLLTQAELQELFSAAGDPMYYIIEEDDLLRDISKKTGLSKATLYALNPELDERRLIPGRKLVITQPEVYLGVKVTKETTYTEEISYTTKRIKDDSMYVNETKVKTSGKNGEKTITKAEVYIDGVKESSKIVSQVVTKEPVTREIYVGTKKRPGGSSYSGTYSSNVGSGTFIRPINGGYVSCGFRGYRGHTGTDFCFRGGSYGKPVYASAGGTVISAGWSGGYGKTIKIRHDNGYQTWYAHLSSIDVSAGSRVEQGQYIGAIGSTGNSTGPHLHFEVRVNGTAVNAMNYI
jgi:murein DD-endopeptidase MepM/ murein hydrolase activator NlpD